MFSDAHSCHLGHLSLLSEYVIMLPSLSAIVDDTDLSHLHSTVVSLVAGEIQTRIHTVMIQLKLGYHPHLDGLWATWKYAWVCVCLCAL